MIDQRRLGILRDLGTEIHVLLQAFVRVFAGTVQVRLLARRGAVIKIGVIPARRNSLTILVKLARYSSGEIRLSFAPRSTKLSLVPYMIVTILGLAIRDGFAYHFNLIVLLLIILSQQAGLGFAPLIIQ